MRQTLGLVCSHIVDCEHKTAPLDQEGEFYAVGTPAMAGNVINFKEARRISATTFELWTRRLLPRAGDLLLAREAPVGPIVKIPPEENVAPGQRTVLLRPNSEVASTEFLYYYLTSPLQQELLQVKAAGSTVAHLNVADVRAFPVHLPDLATQLAIAEVLGALDDKIAANARLVSLSDELMVALAVRTAQRIALAEIIEVVREVRPPVHFAQEEVWHYSLPAFDDGRQAARSPKTAIKSAKFVLSAPCVLISKLNPRFPRVWNIPTLPEGESVASTEFVVLEPTICSTSVLWALLAQRAFGGTLEEKVAGTSGSHQRVKPTDLLSTEVIDPRSISTEAQDQITALGVLTNQLGHESGHLRAVRDALLPQLMSGKLRMRDAEKQVEGVV